MFLKSPSSANARHQKVATTAFTLFIPLIALLATEQRAIACPNTLTVSDTTDSGSGSLRALTNVSRCGTARIFFGQSGTIAISNQKSRTIFNFGERN